MNGHVGVGEDATVVDEKPRKTSTEKLAKYVEDREPRGSFAMDMKGPIRPLDFGEDDGNRRTPAQRRLLVGLVVLVLLVIALVICLVVVVIKLEDMEAENICESEECIRSADNLIQSMDPTVSPCDDFYRFACGRWSEDHPLPDSAYSNDWFTEVSTLINQQMQDFLETNDSESDPESVNKARRLYRSCMDMELLDELGLQPMLDAVEAMGLGPPPAANMSAGLLQGWTLTQALIAVQRQLGLDVLFGVAVWPSPQNRTRNRLTLASPSTTPVLPGYPEVESSDLAEELTGRRGWAWTNLVTEYQEKKKRRRRHAGASIVADDDADKLYVARVLELTARWQRTGNDGGAGEPAPAAAKEPVIAAIARGIVYIHKFVEKLSAKYQSSKLTGVEPEVMTLSEMQTILDNATTNGTSKVNLREFLTMLFEGYGVTLHLDDGDPEQDLIQVYDVEYFKRLSAFLANITPKELQNYVWWKVIDTLLPYTDSEMRILKERYIEDTSEGYSPDSRPHFCANLVNQMMGMAVAYLFYDKEQLDSSRTKMETMIKDIRWAFDERVGALKWMDEETKAATRNKASAMDFLVGFPDWLSEKEAIDEYYEDINTDETTFMENLLNILGSDSNATLASLRQFNEQNASWEVGPPMEPNAAYIPFMNAVVVPAGIMQFPFFLLGLEALNYGAIGSIVGHELTHGFDDEGRKYDPHGNLQQWWTNTTINEYVRRTECFVDQYSRYNIKEIHQHVDGKQTLGENIADNGGLREALYAYRRLKKRLGGFEPGLPGLERYTSEQLFFLSFANIWCEKWTKESLRSDILDEHSPNKFRVTGALVNLPEFSEAWGCRGKSKMNAREDRCVLW